MIKLFRWLYWLIKGKPDRVYAGYHCRSCDKWVKKKIRVPTYQSKGRKEDTKGLCSECDRVRRGSLWK
jgi:tRNA(Ile)-lysidine synthase TilS/MesJ